MVRDTFPRSFSPMPRWVRTLIFTASFVVTCANLWAQANPARPAEAQAADTAALACAGCPDMVVIPAGTFQQARWTKAPDRVTDQKGEGAQSHLVTFSKPFAIGKYDVTFEEWDACVAAGSCKHHPSDGGWGRGKRPVIHVSWYDAQEFITWLNRKTGVKFRLPSEAEWEYAARAGTTTKYWWGDDIGVGRANCDGCGGSFQKQPSPVGSFAANPWGLYDVHGNVWQWVADCWHDNTVAGAPAGGRAWTQQCSGKARRILRGGAWDADASFAGSAERIGWPPDDRTNTGIGFRLARDLN